MKVYFLILSACLGIFIYSSCSKTSPGTDNSAPTNLTLSATVSTDNSGNVSFVATASNAVSYEYDFGNGVYQTVASGSIIYKYPSSGNYTVKVTAKSQGGQTISVTKQISVSVALTLVWADEFDGNGAPDATKWGYDVGAGGWGNNELQYYTNRLENAMVSNGTLKVNLIKESYSGSNYTSARLLSKGKYSFKYGKVEARAKLPAGVGTWPAIWMLGDDISTTGWPGCGEIDIMEHKGSELNKIYGTIHYPGHSGGNAVGSTTMISNATSEFHTYALEWTASAIKISVDGFVYHTVANSTSIPFNHNFFLLINLAMGGTFGGTPDPAVTSATMEVDYIRVYQ